MPSNSRPTMFDPVWSKRSLAEIEVAQNQWDLVKAQEEANEIAEAQKLAKKEQRKRIGETIMRV